MKMTALTRVDLKWLTEPHAWPCLSLYASMARDGYHPEAVLNRLAKSVESIKSQLIESGLTQTLAETFVAPIAAVDELGLQALYADFAGARIGGLAFFLSPDGVRGYVSREEIPSFLAIRPHFELRPLLGATSAFDSFHVLGVSPNGTQLWKLDPYGIHTVALPAAVPASQRDYLANTEFSPKLAYHATGSGMPGATVGKWYGTVARDKEDKVLDDYALAVARPLEHMLGHEHTPVVIVAKKDLSVMLQKHLKLAHPLDAELDASPEHISLQEIEKRARALVRNMEEMLVAQELHRFQEHVGTPRTASTPDDIWDAAQKGQIDILLVSPTRNLPVTDERCELVSATIQEAFHKKARVLLTDDLGLPDSCPMGAILRW